MKHQLLFILFFFIVTISQAQDITSVVVYKFDQTEQQYLPQTKYLYEYDEDDKTRLKAYDKWDFVKSNASWTLGQQIVRDFNEHQHLVRSLWTNYKDGSIKSSIDKKYTITYNGGSEIIEVTEHRYNAKTDESSSKIMADKTLKRVTDYRPVYNRYAPSYLAEHGFDLRYDENNNLIYGQISSCRLQEYHYSYNDYGQATQVVVNRIDEMGQMEKQSKVMLIYENKISATINNTATISAFPNPSKRTVSILFDQPLSEDQEILLTDMYGRLVRTIYVEAFQIEKKIDIADLSAGIYLLNMEQGGQSTQLVKID